MAKVDTIRAALARHGLAVDREHDRVALCELLHNHYALAQHSRKVALARVVANTGEVSNAGVPPCGVSRRRLGVSVLEGCSGMPDLIGTFGVESTIINR